MKTWRQKSAERQLRDVVETKESGSIRCIVFQTQTGPFGVSTFLWYSCAGEYWRQGVTLMLDGSCGTGSLGSLDQEIFEILWGLTRPAKTELLPMNGVNDVFPTISEDFGAP